MRQGKGDLVTSENSVNLSREPKAIVGNFAFYGSVTEATMSKNNRNTTLSKIEGIRVSRSESKNFCIVRHRISTDWNTQT